MQDPLINFNRIDIDSYQIWTTPQKLLFNRPMMTYYFKSHHTLKINQTQKVEIVAQSSGQSIFVLSSQSKPLIDVIRHIFPYKVKKQLAKRNVFVHDLINYFKSASITRILLIKHGLKQDVLKNRTFFQNIQCVQYLNNRYDFGIETRNYANGFLKVNSQHIKLMQNYLRSQLKVQKIKRRQFYLFGGSQIGGVNFLCQNSTIKKIKIYQTWIHCLKQAGMIRIFAKSFRKWQNVLLKCQSIEFLLTNFTKIRNQIRIEVTVQNQNQSYYRLLTISTPILLHFQDIFNKNVALDIPYQVFHNNTIEALKQIQSIYQYQNKTKQTIVPENIKKRIESLFCFIGIVDKKYSQTSICFIQRQTDLIRNSKGRFASKKKTIKLDQKKVIVANSMKMRNQIMKVQKQKIVVEKINLEDRSLKKISRSKK